MNTDNPSKERGRAFDWEGARQRIAAANAALAGISEVEPEVMERVWAQRAAQLAKPLVREEEGEQIELALIRLGREVYGVDVQYVLEIRPAERITHVPRVPEWVAGVVNLSGHILSVIDLRRFFDLAPAEPGEENDQVTPFPDLIVVRTPETKVALLTEDVLAVEGFPVGRMQDVAGAAGGVRPEYVRGVMARGDAGPMVVVLDLPALLGDKRLIVAEEID